MQPSATSLWLHAIVIGWSRNCSNPPDSKNGQVGNEKLSTCVSKNP